MYIYIYIHIYIYICAYIHRVRPDNSVVYLSRPHSGEQPTLLYTIISYANQLLSCARALLVRKPFKLRNVNAYFTNKVYIYIYIFIYMLHDVVFLSTRVTFRGDR